MSTWLEVYICCYHSCDVVAATLLIIIIEVLKSFFALLHYRQTTARTVAFRPDMVADRQSEIMHKTAVV